MKISSIARSLFSALPLVVCALYSTISAASYVNEIEPNDTPLTAQLLSAFSTDFDADIGDIAGNNTSTWLPHVSVLAAADTSSYDWFKFVGHQGLLILDIDYGHNQGVSDDVELGLWNEAGDLLANNDDFFPASPVGAGGSISGFDSFIQTGLLGKETYYVGVCGFSCAFDDGFSMTGNVVDGDYTLHVSNVPAPATLVLFSLGLLGFAVRRRRAA